jgi:hypothetical protein
MKRYFSESSRRNKLGSVCYGVEKAQSQFVVLPFTARLRDNVDPQFGLHFQVKEAIAQERT